MFVPVFPPVLPPVPPPVPPPLLAVLVNTASNVRSAAGITVLPVSLLPVELFTQWLKLYT